MPRPCSRPFLRRHIAHDIRGCTTTASPTARLATWGPTAWTQPAFSCPSTTGSSTRAFSHSRRHCQSHWPPSVTISALRAISWCLSLPAPSLSRPAPATGRSLQDGCHCHPFGSSRLLPENPVQQGITPKEEGPDPSVMSSRMREPDHERAIASDRAAMAFALPARYALETRRTTLPCLPRARLRSNAARASESGKTESISGRITPPSTRRAIWRSCSGLGSTTK
jgi:hypothetical protein